MRRISTKTDSPSTILKKETPVLSEKSLAALGHEIGDKGLALGMYLNVPTTRLVRVHCAGLEKGQDEGMMTTSILLLWKQLRALVKEKEKVADLERALKESGKADYADTLIENFQNDLEFTEKSFPS